MVGYNGNKWTSLQLARMAQIVDRYYALGKRPPWKEIAVELGHPSNSCQQMMSRLRARRKNDEIREQLRELRAAAAPRPPAPPPKPAKPKPLFEKSGSTSTAKLRMEAELRDRIGLLGITGGLLGDPAPGRSALDERRAGISHAPPSHQGQRLPPRITLASGHL